MNAEQRRARRDLRKLVAENDGPVSVYARMALALADGRGIRLSADDLHLVFVLDDAVGAAVASALVDLADDDGRDPVDTTWTWDMAVVDDG